MSAIALKAVNFWSSIELHCGHGYLLSQFLSPLINRRSDQYGGSVEKRAAYPISILEAIKRVVPQGFPLVLSDAACSKLRSAHGLGRAGCKDELR